LELAPRCSLRRLLPERVLLLPHGGLHLLLPGPVLLLPGPVLLLLLLLLLPRVVIVLVVIPVLPGRFRLIRILLLPALALPLTVGAAVLLVAALALRRLQRLALLVGGVRLLPRLFGRLRLETCDAGRRGNGSVNELHAGCWVGAGGWGCGQGEVGSVV
jgi:hypothetical protein